MTGERSRFPEGTEAPDHPRLYREARHGEVDRLPLLDFAVQLIDAYPDDERQDWMRRQIRQWRGQR